jgi:hypothetical protein
VRTGVSSRWAIARRARNSARQALHQHQPVEHRRIVGLVQLGLRHQPQGTVLPLQRHQPQVDIGCEARVQAQFFAAVELTRRQRGEVEERVANRLLQLEHMVAGQKDPRHMRFDPIHPRQRPRMHRVGSRCLQEAQPGLEAGNCERGRVGHWGFLESPIRASQALPGDCANASCVALSFCR